MLDSAQVAEAVAFALERPDHVQVDVINIGHIAGTL
jgi:NADP-dependent 3-hydroxy acid dehydrogenase YdfG